MKRVSPELTVALEDPARSVTALAERHGRNMSGARVGHPHMRIQA